MLPRSLSHVPEPLIPQLQPPCAIETHTGSPSEASMGNRKRPTRPHGGTPCPGLYVSSDHLEFLDRLTSVSQSATPARSPPHPTPLPCTFLIWNSFLSCPDYCVHSNHLSPRAFPGQSPLHSSQKALELIIYVTIAEQYYRAGPVRKGAQRTTPSPQEMATRRGCGEGCWHGGEV